MISGPPPCGVVGSGVDVELFSVVVPLLSPSVVVMLEVLFIVVTTLVVASTVGTTLVVEIMSGLVILVVRRSAVVIGAGVVGTVVVF